MISSNHMKKIRVCTGPHCSYRGSNRIMEVLEKFFGLTSGNKNDSVDLGYCACTGFCEQGPNVVINDEHIIHEAKQNTITEKVTTNQTVPIIHPTADNLDSILNDL